MSIDLTPVSGQMLSDTTQRQPAAPVAGSAATGQTQGTRARPPVGAAQNATPVGQQPPLAQIQQALDEVREVIAPVAQNLLFSIDEDTGRTVVRVVDAETDEVIRQMPSEEILTISKALDKLQGLLIKQEA